MGLWHCWQKTQMKVLNCVSVGILPVTGRVRQTNLFGVAKFPYLHFQISLQPETIMTFQPGICSTCKLSLIHTDAK